MNRDGRDENQPEERPEELGETDSALGSDQDDSTLSLTSSILNYTYENGRRYHAFRAGSYFMPNDEQEQECMDIWHHISTLVLGGDLCRALVDTPQHILDIGTGTGIWAIDVAEKFPGATVIATDLSPIQPRWTPPNLIFEIDDCESDWTFSHQFDYIHIRNLSGAIANWPRLLQQCMEYLKPGGWIEVSNVAPCNRKTNPYLTPETASFRWREGLETAATMIGRELSIGPRLHSMVKDAGFRDVNEDVYMIPLSKWKPGRKNKELALYFQHVVFNELEGISLALYTRVLGWEKEKLLELLEQVKAEIADPRFKMFSNMHYVTGRKPEAAHRIESGLVSEPG